MLTWDLTRLTKPRAACAATLPAQTLRVAVERPGRQRRCASLRRLRKLAACPDQAVTLIKEHCVRQRLRTATGWPSSWQTCTTTASSTAGRRRRSWRRSASWRSRRCVRRWPMTRPWKCGSASTGCWHAWQHHRRPDSYASACRRVAGVDRQPGRPAGAPGPWQRSSHRSLDPTGAPSRASARAAVNPLRAFGCCVPHCPPWS